MDFGAEIRYHETQSLGHGYTELISVRFILALLIKPKTHLDRSGPKCIAARSRVINVAMQCDTHGVVQALTEPKSDKDPRPYGKEVGRSGDALDVSDGKDYCQCLGQNSRHDMANDSRDRARPAETSREGE